jgi:cysteine desulfurase / selenocysteine lyase
MLSPSAKCERRLPPMIAQTNLKEEFPVKNSVAYFNNASYTPMGRAATSAITEALKEYSRTGPNDEYYLRLKQAGNVAREKLTSLVNIRKEDVIFTESATQSINLVANGFKLNSGDVIITRGGATEHPSNYLPWKYYTDRKGVQIVDLEVDEFGIPNLSALDSALKASKAKLVVMSHVLYNLGTTMPVKEAARISHERGARFFLDASQSIGAKTVDLRDIDCDYAAGTAAKWLCGPLGLGFLFVKEDALDTVEPLSFGANACTYTPQGSYKILDSAVRLEEGFRNWIYCHGLIAAIEVISKIGIEEVRKRSLKFADSILEGMSGMPCKMIGSREDISRTSIMPFELLNVKPIEVVQRLSRAEITVAEREIKDKKILRISPHFYNDDEEVDLLLSEISKVIS